MLRIHGYEPVRYLWYCGRWFNRGGAARWTAPLGYQSGLTWEGEVRKTTTAMWSPSARVALTQVRYPFVSSDRPSKDYLLALDTQTGEARWRSTQTFDDFASGPVFGASETVIHGWRGGELIALWSEDGKEVWRAKVPDYQQGSAIGMFALDGALFAMIEPPPCYGSLFGCTPKCNRLLALDGSTGAICWRRDLPTGMTLGADGFVRALMRNRARTRRAEPW